MRHSSLIILVISLLAIALVYSPYIRLDVSAAVSRGPITCTGSGSSPSGPQSILGVPGRTCCQTETDDEGIEIKWCTDCATSRPTGSQCGNRYQASGSSLPPPPGPKAPLENILPGGEVIQELATPPSPPQPGEKAPEVAPPTGPEDDNETQSRINTSPTGGCIPFIKTQCVPCDPGLPGGDCILEDDWETTIGTTAARGAVACGPPPMPACGPHSPPPPPPPTNHVVKGPQIGELPGEEAEQPATVEEQPVPVCQEGLEFNEDLGFCVPTECPEGQELNEETGICVLEEQPAAAEEPEEQQQTEEEQQPQPEGEQPSEESGSEGDNSNN